MEKIFADTEYVDYLSEDFLEHHGVKGMHWGVRRYQNEDGSLTKHGEKRYHIEKNKIVDQYGKKMKRVDRRFMEKSLKKNLKTKDPEKYKEYQKAKRTKTFSRFFRQSNQSLLAENYMTSDSLLSKRLNKKGSAKMNEILTEYANTYLDELPKSYKKK